MKRSWRTEYVNHINYYQMKRNWYNVNNEEAFFRQVTSLQQYKCLFIGDKKNCRF